MGQFLNNLFRKLAGRRGPQAGEIHLAVFGKHPGWDDHVEIGLDTESLATSRQVLYVEGIAGNIDAGKWSDLPPERRLAAFDHAMLLQTDGEVQAARLWSSRDGKGRDRYPLVACAQCPGMPLAFAAQMAMPVLDALKLQCQATETAAGVHEAVAGALVKLRALAADLKTSALAGQDVAPLPVLRNSPELGENDRGLVSAIYHIERTVAGDPTHLRVPACAAAFVEAAQIWLRFVTEHARGSKSALAVQAIGTHWIDLVLGRPRISDFFCLLAAPEALPLTTDIPYTLEPEFITRARAALGPLLANPVLFVAGKGLIQQIPDKYAPKR